VRYYYGVTLISQNRLEDGKRELDGAIRSDPNYSLAFYAAYHYLNEAGQKERAIGYLDRWVSLHPDDVQARQLAQTERMLLQGGQVPGGMGRPPMPPPQLP
jgi:tetratricopeptide (TPR) repeat protein